MQILNAKMQCKNALWNRTCKQTLAPWLWFSVVGSNEMDDIRLQRHRRQKPGNSYRRESLNTIDLLIKIGYFVKKKIYSFSLKASWINWFKEVNCTDPSLSVRIPCRNLSWWRHNSFTSFGQKTFGRQTFDRLSIDLDLLRIFTSSRASSGNLAEPSE